MRPASTTTAAVLVTAAVVRRRPGAVAARPRLRLCRGLAAAVVLLAVGLLLPVTAWAHSGSDPSVQLRLDPLPSDLDGITVQIADRIVHQVAMANPTERVVEVLGLDGRPFLRIGPDGVEANLAVPDWYTTNDPFGGTRVPDDLGGPDRWARVSSEPSWGWYDHRLHPGPLQAPQEIVAIGEPADFDDWLIPLTVDGDPVDLTGRVRFQPVRGTYAAAVTEPPRHDGVTLVILPGQAPGLFLDVTGDAVVEVEGVDGEPFLRVGPEIGVEANLRSRSWVESARAAEGSTPEEAIDPAADPLWQTVSAAPRFGWIDPRLTPATREPDAEVVRAAEPATVLEWTIPLQIGTDEVAVAGSTTWEPVAGLVPEPTGPSDATLRWAAVALVSLLAALGLWVTRRRAARGRPAADRA